MISLDDERWSILEHAHGTAENVPGLLRALAEFPEIEDFETEPYHSLWSALCHQGDVYSASYAAVPHIVAALLMKEPTDAHESALLLVVCIEIARGKDGPPMEEDLVEDYEAALGWLPDVVKKMASDEMADGTCRVAGAALAVASNHNPLAEAMLQLEPDLLDDFLEWVVER